MKDDTIELHLAYVFDCDECGRENFVRAVTFRDDDQLPATAEPTTPEQGGGDGVWMTRPDRVTCKACGMAYNTVDD